MRKADVTTIYNGINCLLTSPLLSADQFSPHPDDAVGVNGLRTIRTRFRVTPSGRVWAVVANKRFANIHVSACRQLPQLIWFRHYTFANHSPKLTDKGVEQLAGHPSLQALDIIDNQLVTDRSLIAASNNQNLRWLAFNCCRVSNKGITALSTATQLIRLAVRHASIDDDCVSSLCLLTDLRILQLEGTQLSEKGIHELRTVLSRCRSLISTT